jgi:hypothetical protein
MRCAMYEVFELVPSNTRDWAAACANGSGSGSGSLLVAEIAPEKLIHSVLWRKPAGQERAGGNGKDSSPVMSRC